MSWKKSFTQARIFLMTLATVVSVFAIQIKVAAQATYRPGEKVMASPSMLKDEKYYKLCTVIKFDSGANAYLLNCDGAEYTVSPAYIRASGNNADKGEASPRDAVSGTETKTGPQTKPAETGKFKIGDRVQASPKMLKDDKHYQPCTVTAINLPSSYGLRCDPFGGNTFMDYSVREDFVRAWKNATPAPTFDCSRDETPAVNLKTTPASAAAFKRVIYDLEAAKNPKTRVGITFETFQIGASFKNVFVNARGLLYSGFPANATIFPVKTRFIRCVDQQTEYYDRTVVESGYACAKNNFGEWSCGVDGGAPLTIDQQKVPKKP